MGRWGGEGEEGEIEGGNTVIMVFDVREKNLFLIIFCPVSSNDSF